MASENSIPTRNMYDPKNKLIVAIDFGTTYSGVAYAFAGVPKPDVVPIIDWPGLEGFHQLKVPTVTCYGDSSTNNTTWGAQKHKGDIVQGLKLLLDPDQPWPLYLPESTAKTDLKCLGKPAVEVAADFLSAIYKNTMNKIESSIPMEYLMMCQKEFVLTVPAVWSDKAKDTTLKAAKQAGIHPVVLIKEPEAAAMYTLHMMKDMALSVGDAFVICDAGRGTVDLISYEITQLTPRLELKELVPGKGGMAGSLGLNKRFEQAVKELVGEDQYFTLCKTIGLQQAVKQFDRSVKTAFRGGMDEEYYVNFPMADLKADPANDLTSNCWNMKGSDIKKIFDPLITDIQRLVNEQVSLVTAIFLVGGFGSSEYLKSCLVQDHPTIQVIQPHDAWAAIVKGAVLSQLPQQALIVSNQATRHYGVTSSNPFDATRDSGQVKTWNSAQGVDTVELMTWYIYQGEDLKCEQVVKFLFYRSFPEATFSTYSLTFTDNLIQSESKIPPIHPSPSATKTNCVLTADLTSVDPAQFKKTVGADGLPYINVYYNLVITIKTAMMKFSIEVNGKEMGTVNASYN
ncbi:Hsp70 family protein-like protein [Leptodontidium sp. 2 PMI_412]|nr:Hsp70 family protein-like protein [Leptodontidium sp. 2 PMI_412]